jgi:putative sterol carrier protein
MTLDSTTARVTKLAENASPIGSVIKFNLKDDQGVILLNGAGEANTVTNEDLPADCTVSVSVEDINALMSGDLNPMMAFMTGKIKVDGDISVAMKLGQLFS